MGQCNINLLKCLIWKHRYVPHCGHTQLYSNAIQCMNAVLNIADMLILSLFSFKFMGIMAWHMIYSTGAIWQCIKVTPDFNLVFKFSKLRRTPNVTASSKTTYSSCSDTLLSLSLSLSISLSLYTHIHTPTRCDLYNRISVPTPNILSLPNHAQTSTCKFVCYPQFVIESNHLF